MPKKLSITLALAFAFALILCACSNSEYADSSDYTIITANDDDELESRNQNTESSDSSKDLSSSSDIKEYLPLDDSEYPYAGIPRIVIETENHRAVKDRETEIPAKLQIWGENKPESEIMDLTIKGRGNSTWSKPKKPYTIKFNQKQNFMGMKKAKKWVLLANYLDRTLIRNAVAFEIAKKTNLEWSPSGKFAEIFLNGKFLGNYFVCEKVQINKSRLNIEEDSYLLEIDKHYDEIFKFKTTLKELPINIKNPDSPTSEQLDYIHNYIDTVESTLYEKSENRTIEDYLDTQSFVDYLIVFELTQNSEPKLPKSFFMYKNSTTLKAGPVWDFDWGTFVEYKKGWCAKKGIWFDALLSKEPFKNSLKNSWKQYKPNFEDIPTFIDSLADYTKKSNEQNIKLWPIITQSEDFPDKDKSFDEAISMMKNVYSRRILELDSLFNSL